MQNNPRPDADFFIRAYGAKTSLISLPASDSQKITVTRHDEWDESVFINGEWVTRDASKDWATLIDSRTVNVHGPHSLNGGAEGNLIQLDAPDDSVDWFQIWFEGGREYRLSGTGIGDLKATLMDENGVTTLASSDSGSEDGRLFDITYRITSSGHYLLKVEKENNQNSAYYLTWEMQDLRQPPASPTLEQPADGLTTKDHTPLLTWSDPLGNATLFNVVLVDSQNTVVDAWTNSTTLLLQTPLRTAKYWWRVFSKNSYGDGGWSDWASFVIEKQLPLGATPVAPAGPQAIAATRPEFAWQAADNAEWYHIWVNRVGEGKFVAKWVQDPATNWTPGVDFRGGDYTWWIVGWNPDGYGPWSAATDFTIPALQPEAITQIAPSGGLDTNNPTFRWTKDLRATWYKLWVSHPEGGTWHDKWYAMAGAGEGTASVSGHPGGTSDWWMRAWGPDGYGPWSGPMTFSTPDPAPAVPTLVSPVGQTDSPVTLQYESARAEWYRVYVSRSGTKVLDRWTQEANFDLGDCPAGNYAWWVAAWNAASGKTVWSGRGDFEVQ